VSKRWRNRRYGRLGNGTPRAEHRAGERVERNAATGKLRFVKTYEWVVAQAVAHLFVGVVPIATEVVIFLRLLTIVELEFADRLERTLLDPIVMVVHPLLDPIIMVVSLICFGFALGAYFSYRWKKPRGV
jgi:hypothetical protein